MFLTNLINITEFILSCIGLLIILLNAIKFFIIYIIYIFGYGDLKSIRINFGNNIIFGLDFTVAADIASSMVQLQYYSIGRLAILVFIRTLLSYFLAKEIESIK